MNQMRGASDIELGHSRLALEAELSAVRTRLAQREQALAVLTRRLLQLESGEVEGPPEPSPSAGDGASEVRVLRAQVSALQHELHWLRHSRIFRWSSPIRRAFYAARRTLLRR